MKSHDLPPIRPFLRKFILTTKPVTGTKHEAGGRYLHTGIRLRCAMAAGTRGRAARARAPERALGWNGGSPFLCGEESCGIVPYLRRRTAGWRATETARPVRNTD